VSDEPDPLAQVTVSLPYGGAMTLADVVTGWARRVARLQAEERSSLDDPAVWGGHDYIGTLHWRSHVEAAIQEAPAELRDLMLERVAAVDEAFLSFTEPDPRGLVGRFANEKPPDSGWWWWWQRMPKAGPAREEIDQFAAS
jgi:hypothetical protein